MNKNNHGIYLTEEGLKELKDELEELINIKRPEIINALKDARALGDLSENADYDAARNDQAVIEERIKEIEKLLEKVTIIKKKNTNKIDIGSCVVIRYIESGEIERYSIVGSQEADPFKNKISNESKIAQVMMGKKKGDKVTVSSPAGDYEIIIEDIC